jgi:hypothetical protein
VKRPARYRNTKVVVDGQEFHSKREAARAGELRLMERAGLISDLTLQPKFPMVINGLKVCTYNADFAYSEDGERIVEDVKSPITAKDPVYRIKSKLLKALHNITIRETF